MIVVHHLNDSRSQRILWLLEELGVPYEIKSYARDAATRLAPPALKAVHPLGKSPVITDGDRTIAESGAIVDYIVRRYGKGHGQPDPASALYDEYVHWLHYAEGSATLPLMLLLYVTWLAGGDVPAPLKQRIDDELANHLGERRRRGISGRERVDAGAFPAVPIRAGGRRARMPRRSPVRAPPADRRPRSGRRTPAPRPRVPETYTSA